MSSLLDPKDRHALFYSVKNSKTRYIKVLTFRDGKFLVVDFVNEENFNRHQDFDDFLMCFKAIRFALKRKYLEATFEPEYFEVAAEVSDAAASDAEVDFITGDFLQFGQTKLATAEHKIWDELHKGSKEKILPC